jgi:hypothetical protein
VNSSNRYVRIGMTIAAPVAILLLAAYALIYQLVPFPGKWNDILLMVINFLASLSTTIVAVLMLGSFRAGDRPRRIWIHLTVGFACWSISEIIWGVYYVSGIEIPIPSIADLFWFAGYIFFTIALVAQYRVINRSITTPGALFAVIGIYILIAINTLGLVAITEAPPTVVSILNYSYPVLDLALGIAALSVMFSFRGGKLALPWIGMFFFSISDVLYAFLVESGLYAQSAQSGNVLSLIADTTYIAAYLVVTLGILNYFLFIKNEQKATPHEKRDQE